tara:strand:- start:85 stop:660 length:576 start_codon:yes stop_codon:yes gene_type:complete
MEDIEKELEEKSIERDVEVQITEVVSEPEEVIPEAVQAPAPVKKVKKPRSEKQIAAFEKARLKRAEGIASRKKNKEEQKELKKEVKKQEKKLQDVAIVQEQTIPKPVVNTPTSKEQVIQNHYYYYGVPPPNHDYTEPKKKKKKSKRPPTPSSSESESSEEEESGGSNFVYDEPQVAPLKQYQPPKYQFSYA